MNHFLPIFPQPFSCVKILMRIWLWLVISAPIISFFSPWTEVHAASLAQAQRVLVETVALTERGIQDSTVLQQTVSKRLAQTGFDPVQTPTDPHDVMVRVKCEERKSWSGPSKHRGRSHLRSAASRLWKGPACQISYRYNGHTPYWKWEVRTSFEKPDQAAKAAGVTRPGLFALQALNSQLASNDFPLYLAAEWGQSDRLISLFNQSMDDLERRRLILQLLGPLPSPACLATLQAAMKEPDLASTAISAMGKQGEVAIPTLTSTLETSANPDLHLAAIQALGEIATHSKAPALFDQFLVLLKSEDPRVQTVAVHGLGKLGDQDAIDPLEELNVQAWTNPSNDPDMQALREALNWSLWQLNPSAHFGE